MKYIFCSAFSFYVFINSVFTQNVGIGNPAPAEKLDVNGNINVTGTIKVNGVDGAANQVLMKNGTGNLVWGDLSEFKKMITFTTVGSSNGIIPAGVTRIWVEASGGGGATGYGGGGGGGYVTAFFDVTPGGTLFYTVGAAGVADGTIATSGGFSSVTYSGSFINATGGTGNAYTSYGYAANGGSFSGSGVGYYGIPR